MGLAVLTSSTHHHKKKYPYFYNRPPLAGLGGLGGGLPVGAGGMGGVIGGGLPFGLGALGFGGFRPGLGGLTGFPFPFRPNGLGNNDDAAINSDPVNPANPEVVSPLPETGGTDDVTVHSANPQTLTPIFIPISQNHPQVTDTEESYFGGSDGFEEAAQDRQATKLGSGKVQRLPIAVIPFGAIKPSGINRQWLQPAKTSNVKPSTITKLPGKQLPPGNTNLVLVIPALGAGGNANFINGQFTTQAQLGAQTTTNPNLILSIPPNPNPNPILALLQQLLNQQLVVGLFPQNQPPVQQPQQPQQQPGQQPPNSGSRQPQIIFGQVYSPPAIVPENISVPDPQSSIENGEPQGQSEVVEDIAENSYTEDDFTDNVRLQKKAVESRNDPEEPEIPSGSDERQANENEVPQTSETEKIMNPQQTADAEEYAEPQGDNEIAEEPEGEVQFPQPANTLEEEESPQLVEVQEEPQDYASLINNAVLQAELQKIAKIAAEAQRESGISETPSPEPTTTPPPPTV